MFWMCRPGTVLEEILVRMVYQDCPVAQHDGRQDLHPVPTLQDPCFCSPGRLASLPCGMGIVVPACSAGLGERSGLEQRVRDGSYGYC